MPKTWIVPPNGITATPTIAVTKTTSGAKKKTHLSAARGDQVFLAEQLDAVGDRLQQALADRCGSGRSGPAWRRAPCARTRSCTPCRRAGRS